MKKTKNKKSILKRTFFFSALLVITTLSLSFSILVIVLPQYYKYYKITNLTNNTNFLAEQLSELSSEKDMLKVIDEFAQKNNAEVWSYDKNDNLLTNYSSSFRMEYSLPNNNRLAKATIEVNDAENDKKNVNVQNNSYLFNINKTINDNNTIQHIEVMGNLQSINEATQVIISLVPYLMLVMVLLGLVLSYFYSRKITQPILMLSKRIKNMEVGKLKTDYCHIYSKDEIGELSENIDHLYAILNNNIMKLQIEMDKVASLEKNKTDFMRMAGHELKTPITALAGIIESMINNIGKYKNHDVYLVECKNIIDNITRLISEILNVSKLDIVKQIPDNEAIELSKIIIHSVNDLQFLSEEKQLKISMHFDDFIVETDSKKITTVLNNLISNAIHYTVFGGKVNISISTSNPLKKQLVIENECTPFKSEDISQLFEPFYTKDISHSKKIEGTGLGLYIVKKNLEVLGFSYVAEKSELGFLIRIIF